MTTEWNLFSCATAVMLAAACSGGDQGAAPSPSDAGGTGGVSGSAGSGGNAGGPATGGSGVSMNGPPCGARSAPKLEDVTDKEHIYSTSLSANVSELRLSKGILYFTENGDIKRMPLGQTTPEVVTHIITTGGRAGGLYLNDTHVFFNENTDLLRAPLDGTSVTAEVIFSGVTFTTDHIVAVDAANVYVFQRTPATISSIPVAGGTPTVVATNVQQGPTALADGYLYFWRGSDGDDELVRTPVGGGGVDPTIMRTTNEDALAVSGSDAYVGTQSGVYHARVGGDGTSQRIMDAAPSFDRSVDAIELSGSRLYWNSGGAVFGWVSTDGTSCAAVVEVPSIQESFVLSGTDLYVTTNDGIYRLAITN